MPIVENFSQDTFGHNKPDEDQFGTIKKSALRPMNDSPVVMSPSLIQKMTSIVQSTYPLATDVQIKSLHDSLYQIDASENWKDLFSKLSAL